MLLGDVLILGSRKAPGVEAVWFGYRNVKLDFSGKGCPFSRKVMPNFR